MPDNHPPGPDRTERPTTGGSAVAAVIDSVRRRVPAVGEPRSTGYECAFCHLAFDRERLNCPACGGPIREGR
jgi:hypothetical protein